jgi:hypothetical protein
MKPHLGHAKPATRFVFLWLFHCLLTWGTTTAMAVLNGPPALMLAMLTLALTHVALIGLIAGLLLADSPGPVRHGHSQTLKRLGLGLSAIWAPVVLVIGIQSNLIVTFFIAASGVLIATGFIAIVVGVTLAAFNLCLTDEPMADMGADSHIQRQFSLRYLIGFTTLVALACGMVKWADRASGALAALAILLWPFLGIALIMCAVRLLTVVAPVGAGFVIRWPWPIVLISIAAGLIATLTAEYARVSSTSLHKAPQLALAIAIHFPLLIGSLATLRSCGLRLTEYRIQYELASDQQRPGAREADRN